MSRKNRSRQRFDDPISNSLVLKDLYHWKWMCHIEALVMGRIEWINLPETMSERFLEQTLMYDGKAVAFSFEGMPMATKLLTRGDKNIYGDYTELVSIGNRNWNYKIPDDQGVVIYNSLTRKSNLQILDLFAWELADLDILAGVNLRQQRNMTVYSGPVENQADLKRIAAAMEQNEETFIATKQMGDDVKVEALSTNVKYMQDEFHQDRTSKLNTLYSFLGIEHIPFEKSERLVAGEASIGNDAIARIREDTLMPRQEAARQMNELLGTDIQVEWRSGAYDDLTGDVVEEEVTEEEDDSIER